MAGGAAQDQAGRPGPWLWQGRRWGSAAAEGGRRVNRLEVTICCADGVLAPLPGWLWLPAELWLIAPG